MGLFDFIGALLGGGKPPPPPKKRPPPPKKQPVVAKPQRPAVELPPAPEEQLAVLPGVVKKADPERGFAVVNGGLVGGIVFASAAGPEGIGALREGEAVEFVVVRRDAERKDRYVLSLDLVPEVRARQEIERIQKGDRIQADVVEANAHGVRVRVGAVPGWLPASELSRAHVSDPAAHVNGTAALDVEVLEVKVPKTWRTDRFNPRDHQAHVVVSARAAEPDRSRPVPFVVSATPFQLRARANLPREFDPVVELVLLAIADGARASDIVEQTGLEAPAVAEILEILRRLHLLGPRNGLTRPGREVVEAIQLVRTFNALPSGGWFVSAAPPSQHFVRYEAADHAPPPPGWPAPLYNPGLERDFLRAAEGDLVGRVPPGLFDGDVARHVAALHDHPRVRLFAEVDRDGDRQRAAPVRLQVPDEWLLGLLWRAFESAQEDPPFHPNRDADHARHAQVAVCVRPSPGTDVSAGIGGASEVNATSEPEPEPDEPSEETVYWEPATDTVWAPSEKSEARLVRLPLPDGAPDPDIPPDLHERLPGSRGVPPRPFRFDHWVRVQHAPRRSRRR